jgi:hypothetical protein
MKFKTMTFDNVIFKSTLLSIAVSALLFTGTANATHQQQFSGINQVTFNDAQYNNAFAGNGFLISYKGKSFAVTVKHSLFVATTPKLTSVYLQDELKEWRIHPNKDSNSYVILGKLLNADKNEPIDNKILSKDWLVFEVKSNHSNLAILELRDTPLEVGELLTAYGCTYATQATCAQDEYQAKYIGAEKNNLRMAMTGLGDKRPIGLSGSPVLDKHNKVVGIISNALKSKTGEGLDSAPASLDYLREVLNRLPN